MEVKKFREVKIVITLTEDEANWLKAIMQNPSPNIDEHYREIFFNALDDV